VVSADTGNGELHPPDKHSVARRLTNAALGVANKAPSGYGPTVSRVERTPRGLSISYSAPQDCIRAAGSLEESFYLMGETGAWRAAQASITRASVQLQAPGIERPIKVRYAWADHPRLSVFSCDGLPASPFELAVP
jgi:sialate O-acetylesterase